MRFTILGASGFIGGNICRSLEAKKIEFFAPDRHYRPDTNTQLGNIIYCIGLTADFRNRPFDTVDAHVTTLVNFLKAGNFDSFLYLSSSRVYKGSEDTSEESILRVTTSPDDLYNISKLMGESVCLTLNNPKIRVARLSNVIGNDFGSDNFLFSSLKEIIRTGKLKLYSSLESEKDYVYIDDVTEMLLEISRSGKYRIYNVASGINTTHREIFETISSRLSFEIENMNGLPSIKFPSIDISRIRREFNYNPQQIMNKLDNLIDNFLKDRNDTN